VFIYFIYISITVYQQVQFKGQKFDAEQMF